MLVLLPRVLKWETGNSQSAHILPDSDALVKTNRHNGFGSK